MARDSDDITIRCHIHIFEEDKKKIEEMFGRTLGFSKACRLILRQFLNQAEAKAQAAAKVVRPEPEVEPSADTTSPDLPSSL